MLNRSFNKWFAIAALLSCSFAMAQVEPTINQIYDAARSGKVEKAESMMQQVLTAHPNSAKAHFVEAELLAQQGKTVRAREELAVAEKLAPGLPFAKADSVQNLRSQLTAKTGVVPTNRPATSVEPSFGATAPASPSSSFPWGMALVAGCGVLAVVLFITRKKAQTSMQPSAPAAYASGNGLNGPQTFGSGAGSPPVYGQPAPGQPVTGGLGGQVMGGLATGLAVGAGVMAAQAIGRNFAGHEERTAPLPTSSSNDFSPLPANTDMGGQNFGLNDTSSWNDAGNDIADAGGGGDWDT